MDGYLRQSTASQSRLLVPTFVDDTDFKTPETGLTIANTDIKLRANGTTLSNKNSGGATHQVNGQYSVTWDATDTANVGQLAYSIVVAGALPVFGSYEVLEEAVYDALFAASAPGYLQPTTAGRTLDVTATGAAGIDWGNVENPTTTVGLSGTTVKTATDVETDTQDIQSRLPAALVSGRMDASVGAYQSGLTPLQPTVAGRTLDVTTTGEAGIDWGNIGASTTTQNLSGTTVKTATDVETDTQDIQSRLPAALVSGRIDASVGAMAANTLTASALAADAGAEIADAVWDEALSGHTTAGSAGKALSDAGSAGDPWSTALPGAYSAGTAGHIVGTALPDIAPGSANGLLRAGSNAATSITTALTANIIGNITGNLSGSIGSVAAGGITAASFAANALDAVWSTATRSLTTFGTLVADVATAVWGAGTRILTAGTNIVLAKGTGVTGFNDPTATQNADALLDRDMGAGTDSNSRSPRNALRFLRNKWSIAGGVLTVTKENDSTTAWTGAVTQTAGDPVSEIDPT